MLVREVQAEIFDYIQVFYSRARRHQHIDISSVDSKDRQVIKGLLDPFTIGVEFGE
jgi:hypothetical protein